MVTLTGNEACLCQPGRDPQAAELVEEELEMAQAWLPDRDLLDDHNGKEVPPEWVLYRFWALCKC